MKKNLILMMLLLAGAVSMNGQGTEIADDPIMVVTGSVVNTGTLISKGPIDLRTNAAKDSQINNTATGDIKTPALTVGEFTLVTNEGNLCVGCEEATPPSYPAGTIMIPNVRTGFISDAYEDYNLIPKATYGDLLIAAADVNPGTLISWNAISNYTASGTSYAHTDASKFEGPDAGCEAGWRLPSIVEIKAIADYFKSAYGSNTGPTTEQVPGFSPMFNDAYWSSTYFGPDSPTDAAVYFFSYPQDRVGVTGSSSVFVVRCVRDL